MYRANGHTIVNIQLSRWLDTHNEIVPGGTALRAASWRDMYTNERCWLYYCELYDNVDHQPEIFYDYHGPVTGLLTFFRASFDDFRHQTTRTAIQRWFGAMSQQQKLQFLDTLTYND